MNCSLRVELQQKNKPFPCTRCGECCRGLLRNILSQRKVLAMDHSDSKAAMDLLVLINEFPYKLTPVGICEMLNKDNTCRVYEHRPRLCQVNVAGPILFPDLDMDEIHKINAQCCNDIIEISQDIPQKDKKRFKVKL